MREILMAFVVYFLMFLIIAFIFMLSGCTNITWTASDGTKLTGYSLLSNKHISGSLIDGKRTLTITEFDEDQISGAAAITKSAVEGAVKGAIGK